MEVVDIRFPHLGIELEHVGKIIQIGDFTIAYYGVIIAIGMLVGLALARFQAARTGQDKEMYLDLALFAIVFAVIGARIYYVIFSWDSYKDNLLDIFNLRGGGLAIYGGIIGGVVTTYVFARVRKQSFRLLVDTAVAGLAAGQAIGRWGNFFNREAFGGYTDSLFAMQIPRRDVLTAYISEDISKHIQTIDGVEYIQVHPTFLYESVWNLLVLAVVLLTTKKKKFDGQLFCTYAALYGLGRMFIERLRTDQLKLPFTSLPVSECVAAVCVVVFGGILLWELVLKEKVKVATKRSKSDKMKK